ncbi:hypothetical protein HMPREF1129_1328 [Actinomyces naeslundii str. Howell 279]|uniref:Uncharacterized protein n=1 Tax=Actinomyces naeslundii (strain ATCC 12104 / DSM 43013 / CCUG 2238 / JCM 8349 / NCTC 10301 / Howell 279) TaxID=1115803 RepID=J2ZSA5_ACTNH|nr:hypothetical protein HMPREF1129_1328 [Actinomyces naeslundii str. Howell 279]
MHIRRRRPARLTHPPGNRAVLQSKTIPASFPRPPQRRELHLKNKSRTNAERFRKKMIHMHTSFTKRFCYSSATI